MFRISTALATVASATIQLTWQDCGDASTHGHITDLQPTTFNPGDDVTVKGTGTLDEDVPGGSFEFKLTASGLIHQTFTGDICAAKEFSLPLNLGTIGWGGMSCPVAKGKLTVPLSLKLSSKIPQSLANGKLDATVTSSNKDKLACINAQFKKQYAKGFKRMPRNSEVEVAEITDEMRAAAPASLDWTTQGATTPVKDQGGCGSCWAYSATQGVESGLFMTSGKETLMKLAEQQVISCDKTDEGCGGGDLPTAFSYIKSAGLDTQEDYPDTSSASGSTGSCKQHEDKVTLLTSKYAIPPCDSGSCSNQDEDGLKAALAAHGPLSICVNAEPWNDYYGGVLTGSCSGAADTLDHCVQLVGYDTTGSQSYWKVKNSWNTNWGEDGFIRLPMGENSCGVADEAMYTTAQVTGQNVVV